jgi:hypothetical protein
MRSCVSVRHQGPRAWWKNPKTVQKFNHCVLFVPWRVPGRIIRFRCIHREEHGIQTACAGAGQIHVAVGVLLANVATLQKLPCHYMDVPVHHESISMKGACLGWPSSRTQQDHDTNPRDNSAQTCSHLT